MNKITVAIPSRNPIKEWLQQCLSSCEGVDEIIIGDDASSPAINLNDYVLPSCGARLIRSETNIGCPAMANRLVPECTGDFISVQADDDYFNTEVFGIILQAIKHSTAAVVHFPCQYFGKYDYIFGNVPGVTYSENYANNMVYGASFFRKQLWVALQGFHGEVAQDWDFWNRALKSGFIFEYVNELGAYFRVTKRSFFENALSRIGRDKINKMVRDNCDNWKYEKAGASVSV
jgi:hypothetical protein